MKFNAECWVTASCGFFSIRNPEHQKSKEQPLHLMMSNGLVKSDCILLPVDAKSEFDNVQFSE